MEEREQFPSLGSCPRALSEEEWEERVKMELNPVSVYNGYQTMPVLSPQPTLFLIIMRGLGEIKVFFNCFLFIFHISNINSYQNILLLKHVYNKHELNLLI